MTNEKWRGEHRSCGPNLYARSSALQLLDSLSTLYISLRARKRLTSSIETQMESLLEHYGRGEFDLCIDISRKMRGMVLTAMRSDSIR